MRCLPARSFAAVVLAALLLGDRCAASGGGGSRTSKKIKKKKSKSKKKSIFNHNKINDDFQDLTTWEVIVEISGEEGFDRNGKDFDILRTLIETADLVDEVNGGLDDVTIFPPNDDAFCRTARKSLGYQGRCIEEEVLAFYVGLLETIEGEVVDLVTDILSYHVALGEMTVKRLREKKKFTTLCECFEIGVERAKLRGNKRTTLLDDGPRYPKIDFKQQNIKVVGGIVHVIKGVLLPPFD